MTWSVALRLGRVSNLPTVWTNVLAGLVLAGVGAPPALVAALLAALTFFYLGGMYLNDAFDREIDARERPERPIPAGVVTASTVFGLGFGFLSLGTILLAVAGVGIAGGTGWAPAAAGLVLAVAIVFYNWNHKGNPLSPIVMGICRMLIYVIAALAVTTDVPGGVYLGALALLCYLIGLTYAAKQEHLNRIAHAWPLIFLGVPFVYVPVALGLNGAGGVAYAVFFLWVVYALTYLLRSGHVNVPRAVVSLLAGICLFDALLIAASGSASLALLAGAGFLLTLLLQRWVPGT